MANSDDLLRAFLCPELLQWWQSDDEDENKDPNLHVLLRASNEFNSLQQHVAQHPLHYSQLPASFNKLVWIVTDIQRVDSLTM